MRRLTKKQLLATLFTTFFISTSFIINPKTLFAQAGEESYDFLGHYEVTNNLNDYKITNGEWSEVSSRKVDDYLIGRDKYNSAYKFKVPEGQPLDSNFTLKLVGICQGEQLIYDLNTSSYIAVEYLNINKEPHERESSNNNTLELSGKLLTKKYKDSGSTALNVYSTYLENDKKSLSATNNKIVIDDANGEYQMYGIHSALIKNDYNDSKAKSSATQNSITIKNGDLFVTDIVAADVSQCFNGTATAENNQLVIEDGIFHNNNFDYGHFTAGVVASDNGSAYSNNNSIKITGGKYTYNNLYLISGQSSANTFASKCNENEICISGEETELNLLLTL